MMRRFLVALALVLTPSLLLAAEPSEPLKVLFLGDKGHHPPADRAAQLIPVLAGRGIEITYTEKLADLNPENLARYDGLIVYANIDADRAGAGEGPARLRRRRQGLRPAPLRVVLLPQLAEVHRPGRRAVPQPRHRRVRHEGRRRRTTRS